MRYSLIIFDLDGTLADSFPWFLGSLNSVADAFRLRRVAGDEIEPLRRVPTYPKSSSTSACRAGSCR